MTKEQRNLLQLDLAARLPHNVKVRYSSTKQFFVCTLQAMNPSYNMVDLWSKEGCFTSVHIDKIKPYLFPMSSMTEEQREEYTFIVDYISSDDSETLAEGEFIYVDLITELMHFYNKYHLDYRGLIPKGLALDATGLNIY